MTSEPTTAPLLTYRDGAVLIVQNNNPAARNALTPAFMQALPVVLAQAQEAWVDT